ncbi:hypothetical protein [Kutzneria sp. NPDC052558]|uniref:hypothetical protein n=1 Tax=Kutzneria sp. NPDC052558 TaxID=3364121 RepID=UPI0037C76FB9
MNQHGYINNTVEGDDNHVTQVGVVNGGAVFHGDSTVYQVTQADPPQRKFEVARNHLAGNSPRIAESLLAECVRAGFVSTEVAYFYALATLSERSLNQLGPDEFEHVRTALTIAERCPHDGWWTAIGVIGDLLRCVTEQETSREADPQTLAVVLDEFGNLDRGRQEEITRHLDMIIGGAIQDQLDHFTAAAVEQARVSDDRSGRAWKFFQPTPTEPVLSQPYFTAQPSSRTWMRLVAGTFGLLLAALLSGSVATFAVTLVLAAAGAAVAWFGGRALAAQIRRDRLEFELGAGGRVGDDDPGDLGSPLFRRRIWGAIVRRRGREQPVAKKERKQWQEDLARPADSLFGRMVRTYGRPPLADGEADSPVRQRESEVDARTLNWLVYAQMREWSRQWRAGELFSFRKMTTAQIRDTAIAVGAGLFGILAVYWVFLSLSGAAGLGLLAAASAAVGTWGWTELLGGRTALSDERADCQAQLDWELAEFRKWQDKLADQPADAEMARWLDFDKAHLKTEAMRHADLTNRDIVGHVVLTEGLPRARRARVIYGPPRYSAYRVLVFLLTENGVWEFRVDLDFTDGSVRNQETSSFRYESLVRVRVAEVGVKFANERRQVIVIKNDELPVVTDPRQQVVLSRALWLSLTNQDDIQLVLENFEGLRDEQSEKEAELAELALGASGAASAVRILQSVAGEGRDWITRQRQRRDRRLREWARDGNGQHDLLGAPTRRAISQPTRQQHQAQPAQSPQAPLSRPQSPQVQPPHARSPRSQSQPARSSGSQSQQAQSVRPAQPSQAEPDRQQRATVGAAAGDGPGQSSWATDYPRKALR